jgi:hypothetical protein
LDEILLDWKENTNREEKEYIEFHNQLKESKEEYNQISKNFSYKNHSVFNMTSKSINTRQINELLENSERTVVDNFEQEVYELEEYESMRIKTNSVEIESDLCEQRPQIQQPPKK